MLWRPPWPQITTEDQEPCSKQVQPKAASSSSFQGDFPKRQRKKCKEGLLAPATQQCGSLGYSLATLVSSVSSKGLVHPEWQQRAGSLGQRPSLLHTRHPSSVSTEKQCSWSWHLSVLFKGLWCGVSLRPYPHSTQETHACWLLAKTHTTCKCPECKVATLWRRRWGGVEHSSLPLSLLRGLKFPRWDLTQEEKSSRWATVYSRIRPVIVRGSYMVLISFLFPFLFSFLSYFSVITSFLWHPQLWLRALYSRTKLAMCQFVCSSCASKPGALSLTSAPLGYNSLQQECIRRRMRELLDLEDALAFYS